MDPKILSIISIFVNLLLAVLKLFVGLFTNSIALMAEALHSGLDIISSFITFLGIRISSKPADKKHPYGYERYQGLAAFVIVILLFISALWILFEGIKNMFLGEADVQFSFWMIVVMALSVILNEIMARAKFFFGNKYSSIALVADAEHDRADVISSLAVIVGIFLIRYFTLADSLLAIIVALYIFYEAYVLSKETIDSLVDTSNPELENQISELLKKSNFNFSEIKTRKIGASNFAEIYLLFNPKLKIEEVNDLTTKVEELLLDSIEELKQVSILVKSHQFAENIVRPEVGKCFHFRRRLIEHKKSHKQEKIIVIPLENGEIASELGAPEYLIKEIDSSGNIIRKYKKQNPYFEKGELGHGIRFIKFIFADKVFAKHIGSNAKNNLDSMGVEYEIVDKNKKLKDLNL